jgi:hypothetical protein
MKIQHEKTADPDLTSGKAIEQELLEETETSAPDSVISVYSCFCFLMLGIEA